VRLLGRIVQRRRNCRVTAREYRRLREKRLKKFFALAETSKGDGNAVSHRLRDTLAVELRLAGVPIERVSVLLGHSSVRVTEKHYNPWVRSRQGRLEADVASVWKLDPILDSKIIRTNSVQLPWRVI
jgi:integrase